MVRVAAAVVCDFAQVREGLLTTVSAGITRCWREELPAKLGVYLALLLEVPAGTRHDPHEVRVAVSGPSGRVVARVGGGFQVARQVELQFDADEDAIMPLPIPLVDVPVDEYGWYSIEIAVDGGEPVIRRVKVAARPAQPPQVPLNRQQRRHRPN